MGRPTLVVISGHSGSGKTTLAHELARAIRCPAICRDEIKEGMVHTTADFEPAWGDPLTVAATEVFFRTLRLLLEAGTTLVADAAFQDKVWRPNLEPLTTLAEIRVVQCHTDATIARQRIVDRASSRNAHADAAFLEALDAGATFADFDRVSIDVPSIDVDTTSGYEPSIDDIVAFVNT